MNIPELSKQLRELSEDYSNQRIALNEYRLKRKYLLDEIDQRLNNQNCGNLPKGTEKVEECDDVDRDNQ